MIRVGVMGLGVLSRFRVILDYPRERMILEETSLTHEPFEGDMSGTSFWPHAEIFVIKRVRPNSPAAAAGLLEGNFLRQLDDRSVKDLQLRELEALLRSGHGERTRLVLRRDEEVIEAELILQRRY